MQFPNRVREQRIRRGMPAAEMARRIGVSRMTVYLIEVGRRDPTLDRLRHIARVLDVDLCELVDEAPQAVAV